MNTSEHFFCYDFDKNKIESRKDVNLLCLNNWFQAYDIPNIPYINCKCKTKKFQHKNTQVLFFQQKLLQLECDPPITVHTGAESTHCGIEHTPAISQTEQDAGGGHVTAHCPHDPWPVLLYVILVLPTFLLDCSDQVETREGGHEDTTLRWVMSQFTVEAAGTKDRWPRKGGGDRLGPDSI